MKNVPGLYGSKIGGDNGAQTKSTNLNNSGQAGMDSKPVKFSGASETVPTGPKEPSSYPTKGKTDVKHANQWKNAPAQAGQDLEKAPAWVKKTREINRQQAKRIKELESKLESLNESGKTETKLPTKPTLQSCEYDEDHFSTSTKATTHI